MSKYSLIVGSIDWPMGLVDGILGTKQTILKLWDCEILRFLSFVAGILVFIWQLPSNIFACGLVKWSFTWFTLPQSHYHMLQIWAAVDFYICTELNFKKLILTQIWNDLSMVKLKLLDKSHYCPTAKIKLSSLYPMLFVILGPVDAISERKLVI